MKCLVYSIKCDLPEYQDCIYIGSTSKTLRERFNGHKASAKICVSTNLLYEIMRKVGSDHFNIQVVEAIDAQEKDKLIIRESKWLSTITKDGHYGTKPIRTVV